MSGTTKKSRYPSIDALRGVAIAMMFVYHFCFDLAYFRLVKLDFYTGHFWIGFRIIIVSLFLLLVGVSLYLATRNGINWRSYIRRLALISFYATLVSLSSYLVFPDSMIFFGILHFIAVASVLGLLFIQHYKLNLAVGLTLLVAGFSLGFPFFDQPMVQWFGLMTHKPRTEDYVPLLPWFGMVLIGLFLGRLLLNTQAVRPLLQWQSANTLSRVLQFGGRHSLHIYMLHQPVFFALIYLWLWLSGSL